MSPDLDAGSPYRGHVPETVRAADRALPLALRLRVLFERGLVPFTLTALATFMLFTWLAASRVDWELVGFDGPTDRYLGVVSRTEPFSTGGSHRNGRGISWRVHFRYQHDGATHESFSIATSDHVSEGTQVYVDVPRGHDDLARISGLDSPHVPHQLFFAVVGLLLVAVAATAYGLHRRRLGLRLLAHGRLATGRKVACERGPYHHPRRPQWKVTVDYEDHLGRVHRASVLTNDGDRVDERASVQVVHDVDVPGRAVLAGFLPGSPRIVGDAIEVEASPWRLLLAVVPPVLFVGANVAGALIALFALFG